MTHLVDALVPSSDHADQRAAGAPQPGRRPAAVAALVVLGLVVLLTGVTRWGGSRWAGAAVAELASGSSVLIANGERWSRLLPGETVPEGGQIRTKATEARLRLDDGEVWLAPETAARIFSDRVEMSRGEILVASGGKLRAQWQDTTVVGEGIFRLAGGTHPRTGVYQGHAELTRPGETRALAALDQLQLAARRLPTEADPLAYSSTDPWDTQLLGQAIAFDAEAARVASSIALRFSDRPRSEDFYRRFTAVDDAVVPTLHTAARDVFGDGRFGPPSEVLITLFAAQATARAWRHPVDASLERIVHWRAHGARWGLVSLRAKITVADFTRALDLTQVATTVPVAQPPATQVAAETEVPVQERAPDVPVPVASVPAEPETPAPELVVADPVVSQPPASQPERPGAETVEETGEGPTLRGATPELDTGEQEIGDETVLGPDPAIELPDLGVGELEEGVDELLDLLGEVLSPREML